MPVLQVEKVTKRWSDGTLVLDDVSLDVQAGERVWLCGQNGAGKTTLLRTAAGVLRPDSGSVRSCGVDVERERMRFHRSVVLLSASAMGLYARLRVRHHLDLWCALGLVPRRDREDAIARAVRAMDLGDLLSRRVDRMSMGQRQRLRLAGTFLQPVRLVLLDEPANSLDEDGFGYLQRAIDVVREAGGGSIWCSPSGQPPIGGHDVAWELRESRLVAA